MRPCSLIENFNILSFCRNVKSKDNRAVLLKLGSDGRKTFIYQMFMSLDKQRFLTPQNHTRKSRVSNADLDRVTAVFYCVSKYQTAPFALIRRVYETVLTNKQAHIG